MCGIVGYVGSRKASVILLRNLRRLEYRGYDSCGLATVDEGLHVKKDVGTIDDVHRNLNLLELPGMVGIAHTRWATHGNVTKSNAHPHLDCHGRVAVVHNGIISNYEELKAELLKRGHRFSSETDTECIAHLIEDGYDGSLEEAALRALKRIRGTYALLVVSTYEPEKLICARKESPLILGLGDGEVFVGSDAASFLEFTRKAVALDDGEYAVITKDGYVVREISTGRELDKKVLHIDWSIEMAEKEGNPHFMLKEILEQPRVITNALNVYPEQIRRLAEMIKDASPVYIVAAGTSLHAGMVAEYWFSQLCSKPVYAVDSSEFAEKSVVDENTLVIGVTQSGETYDTLAAMRQAKRKGAKVAAIVNVIGSTATRLAEHVVLQGSGIEISVCATKTFTSQLTILLRTALELAKLQGKNVASTEKELMRCPGLVEKSLALRGKIKRVAGEYFNVKNYIFIGKGINYPSALEGALKLKEITYNHAEGMSGGMLKHGTISLIEEGLNTVAIVPARGENRTRIISNIQEVKARGGVVIGIASGRGVEQCDVSIVAPSCEELVSPIVFAPIYQLLAYYSAVNLGRNVDKPRALAKSVTVE
jgi:glucosamine--fructose-6-phosphate aminotransferase (isomerizing)